MNKKKAGIIAVAIIALSGISFAFAGNKDTQNNGVPFKEIWDAINGLQENVVEIWEYIEDIELTPGPEGPKGDPGDTGLAGPEGPKGDPGDTGLAGPEGPKGDPGDTGLAGPEGLEGPPGEKGDTGDKGDTGTTGPRGPQGFLGKPDYDSGFQLIALKKEKIFTHDLGTQNLFVYVLGRDFETKNIHQFYLGGHAIYTPAVDELYQGLHYYWNDDDHIKVFRFHDDDRDSPFNWDHVRVMIWKIPS